MIQWVGYLSALKPFGGHVDPLDTVVVHEVLGHDNDTCELAQLASRTFKGAMVPKFQKFHSMDWRSYLYTHSMAK